MARNFCQGQLAQAHGWVEDGDAAPPYRLEHHKMVQVPMQYSGALQLRQLVQLQPHRAAAELQGSCIADDLLQIAALERQRKTATKVGHIQIQTMRLGNHRQAGQAAFAGFGLEDGGHLLNLVNKAKPLCFMVSENLGTSPSYLINKTMRTVNKAKFNTI